MLDILNQYLFLILKLVSVTGGVYLLLKEKMRYYVLVFYYATVTGIITGYLIGESWFAIFVSIIIINLICVLLKGKTKIGESYILIFILLFQSIYILCRMIIDVMKIDFYKMLDIYPDLVGNSIILNVSLIVSFVIAVIISAITIPILRKRSDRNNINHAYYKCLAIVCMIGGVYAASGMFEMTGDWQDVFLPLLNIEYGKDEVPFGIIIFSSFLIIFLCFKLKKKGESSDSNRLSES